MRYVDSSVLVAYYTPEQRSEEAALLLRAGRCLVSDLAVAEVLVTLERKRRDGRLSTDAASALALLFNEHLQDGVFERVRFESHHADDLTSLAGRTTLALRTLDALHLVIARKTARELLTFDGRLAGAARDLGFAVAP